jgi:RimJ/RimL family protein N-acetyltransferase
MSEPIFIPTQREGVVLRELSTLADDVAYYQAYDYSRPEIIAFDPDANTKYRTIKDATDARVNKEDRLRMGIWDGDTFVGSVNARPDEGKDSVEVGYWVHSKYTSNGYATLAATAISEYSRDRFSKVHAKVVDGNDASARVLEKAGFQRTGKVAGKLIFLLPN